MCKSVFVHIWRAQGVAAAEGVTVIGHCARYSGLYSPIWGRRGLMRRWECA